MPTIHANDLEVAYAVRGHGPPIVLLHGASSSGRDNFPAQLPVLADLFRVYLPDARGHAGTRWDELNLVDWSDLQKQTFLKMQFTARQQQYCLLYPLATDRIILQDSEAIGRLLVDQEERYLVLIDIALLPAHQNRGIGTMLVQSLLEEAAATAKSVRLHVLATNPAVRMYERLGFTATDEDGTYLEMKCLGQRSVCSQ